MINFLVRHFVGTEDIKTHNAREKAGFLGSTAGIIANILLFILKFTVGALSGSVSVTADAFNNLSDTGSCIVTFIGFKIGDKPADAKHPFGYGRIEYISGFVVAILIIYAGAELAKTSFIKMINPAETEFTFLMPLLLLLSIPVKLWLSALNGKLGKMTDSPAMEASAADSRNDVIVTCATIVSAVLVKLTSFYALDGIVGVIVALFVLFSGISIMRETLAPLLGEAPKLELAEQIEKLILSGENVCGVHDIIVHNYGPGKYIASAHAEVPADCDILKVHDEIDNIEQHIASNLGVLMTIHMDPVETDNESLNKMRRMLSETISGIDQNMTFHDLRAVSGDTHTNLIFDVVVPKKCKLSDDEIKARIDDALDPYYRTVIVFDRAYI